MVVIVNLHSNRLMKRGKIFVPREVASFTLKATKPTFHEPILPGARFVASTQLDFHFVAQILVFVAEILTPLVAM